MIKRFSIFLSALLMTLSAAGQGRSSVTLSDWQFRKNHDAAATEGWENVKVPHDWAIYGPFDRANDLQEVAVVQNGENIATVKTGRSGGLPYMGKGCYKTGIEVSSDELAAGSRLILLFDGAMSQAQVFVNGEKVGEWAYGYNSFHVDVTDAVHAGSNEVYVLLENLPQSSRWYPGAGLYRKVRLLTLPKVHVPVWGTYISTPYVGEDYACVSVKTEIAGLEEFSTVTLHTVIKDAQGHKVAESTDTRKLTAGKPVEQQLVVNNPELWSPETPILYTAHTELITGGDISTDWSRRHKITVTHGTTVADAVNTRFGIRSIEFRPGKGFFLNGEVRKFKGVCLHHDLGPLGAAVNASAIRHQLNMLKDMGCDAIRTTHNMPAEELIQLCDEMGFMVIAEAFDEWNDAKCDNGYHRFFDNWAEKDMVNMLRHFRNHPSIVMWSTGNEVPTQWKEGGWKVAEFLQNICHAYDPTRPATCGMDQFDAVLGNGFGQALDVVGFNYKVARYPEALALLPQGLILGSETASTVSSRGVYQFPMEVGYDKLYPDHQSSSYDVEFCSWSNIPDDDFVADADYDWVMGQFVWTGFDYLGEPSPYDTDAWPNHSSMFGIIDLASIPKDRFWLYRSIWNEAEPTLHMLPHWTWPGREGQVTPVMVYTSWPSAELFVNGVSQGIRTKADGPFGVASGGESGPKARAAMERFRLIWDDVVYQPGEIRVVAYDAQGNAVAEKTVATAGKPKSLKLTPDPWNSYRNSPSCYRNSQSDAPVEELIYINVSVTDSEGNPVPTDNRPVSVSVSGAGSFKAMANGDPTSLELFHEPKMHLFSGQLTVLVARDPAASGPITVKVSAKGLRPATIQF